MRWMMPIATLAMVLLGALPGASAQNGQCAIVTGPVLGNYPLALPAITMANGGVTVWMDAYLVHAVLYVAPGDCLPPGVGGAADLPNVGPLLP